jgi:uncharacterized protein (TIGR02594 family)
MRMSLYALRMDPFALSKESVGLTKRLIPPALLAAVSAAVLPPAAAEARVRHPAAPRAQSLSEGSRRAPARGHAEALGSDVVAEAEHWLGWRNMTGKGGPWCAHFASYILQRTGHAPLANGMASAALSYGRRLSEPKVGALAVVTTRVGYAAHVGFVAGVNADGSIELVSGNWGRRVADSTVSRRLVVAFVDVR